ncbi:MAG: type II and III secretion system protein [Pseudomonadales bacterium]|nr:type II and III secretion system protein [Pseudomonadales bacterium]
MITSCLLLAGCQNISESDQPRQSLPETQPVNATKPEPESPQYAGGTRNIFAPLQEESTQSTLVEVPCKDPVSGVENTFALLDLDSEVFSLSNTKPDRAIATLRNLGVTILDKPVSSDGQGSFGQPAGYGSSTFSNPMTFQNPSSFNSGYGVADMTPANGTAESENGRFTCSELPVYYNMSATGVPVSTTSVGGAGFGSSVASPGLSFGSGPAGGGYSSGSGSAGSASKFSYVTMGATDFGRTDALMVFYHPETEQKKNKVNQILRDSIDAPGLQVYIESMVLEVNEEGMERLGVIYDRRYPPNSSGAQKNVNIGLLNPLSPASASAGGTFISVGKSEDSSGFTLDSFYNVQLDAMIADGTAEVLSRPSVITLNDRPAVIEIGEQKQYPIRSTTSGFGGAVEASYSFEEVTPGILLQLRPRIGDETDEVSMEIDVQVKALVAANDGNAINDTGVVIATKPGSSTRRVHTFATVPNNMPIIIGGLVSRNKEEVQNKLPYLGDIPVLGRIFGAESESRNKKEVIIVITPHIIRDTRSVGVHTPKDSAMFDDSNMFLFRDSYRLRSSDIFDLGFIYNSRLFQQYKRRVDDLVSNDPSLATAEPFSLFHGDQFPGGDVLVSRMLYDIVKKQNLFDNVVVDQIVIAAGSEDHKGFDDVINFYDSWKQQGSTSDRALEIAFSNSEDREQTVSAYASVRSVSLAQARLADQMSYKASEGMTRIYIEEEDDLDKIRAAIVVRELQRLNGSQGAMEISQMNRGRQLILPVITKDKFYLLDKQVARIYTEIKNYYSLLEEALRDTYAEIDKFGTSQP